MNTTARPFGAQLRDWRQRRNLSQLALACEAELSSRHLSFLETGRSIPSREMVLRLADRLDIPLRDQNSLLLAAGFAPAFPTRSWEDPALDPVRQTLQTLLTAHEPYPALAIDRHWCLVASNRAVGPLLRQVAPWLLSAPVNVLRLSLHPDGLGGRIVNFAEWHGHVMHRLGRQRDQTADPTLSALFEELAGYGRSDVRTVSPTSAAGGSSIAVPLQLVTEVGVLSLLSTTMVFGTPLDVSLSELAVETFLPADTASGDALRRLLSNQLGGG
jgi:transcriptional regulator with XRE-family HTH domain